MSVDLQKVMLCPRLPGLKKAFFCIRLVAFNESFVPVGTKHWKALGVLWHEGIAGRSAAEVAGTFINVVRSSRLRDYKHITFWADNCSGQNKNWYLFSALIKEINILGGNAETITIKFFEPGHTFMLADSFLAQVEKGIKKKIKLQDYQDLVDIVNEKGEAMELKFNIFFDIKKEVSQGKYASNKPKLENVQVVCFIRG